jgi:hypothetical protein
MERIKEVGEITVKLYRAGEGVDITKTTVAETVDLRGVEDTVHEKALKGDAKSHAVL